MKTAATPATEPATHAPTNAELRMAGIKLLHDLVNELQKSCGYRQVAIDTYIEPATRHTIRHSYVSGTWILSCGYENAPRIEVRYGIDATMPDVSQLLNSVLPAAF